MESVILLRIIVLKKQWYWNHKNLHLGVFFNLLYNLLAAEIFVGFTSSPEYGIFFSEKFFTRQCQTDPIP